MLESSRLSQALAICLAAAFAVGAGEGEARAAASPTLAPEAARPAAFGAASFGEAERGASPPGWSAASWRVASNGETLAAPAVEIETTADAPPLPSSSPAAAEAESWVGPLLRLARLTIYAGLAFGLGGLVFSFLTPSPLRRVRQIGQDLIAAALVALPISVSLAGLELLKRPLSDAIFPEVWRAGLLSSSGSTALMAAAALALGLIGWSWRAWRGPFALAALAAAAVSLGFGGQTDAAAPRLVVATQMSGLLLLAGALLPLGLLLARPTRRATERLARFSGWLPWVVAATAASGLWLAAASLGRPGPRWTTGSGAFLLAQILLLLCVAGLAFWSRARLARPFLAGAASGGRRLRDAVALAATLIFCALVMTVGWRLAPSAPPPAEAPETLLAASSPEGSASGRLTGHGAEGEIRISPQSTGPVRIDLRLRDLDDAPLKAIALRIGFAPSAEEPARLFYEAEPLEDGLWRVKEAHLPALGDWRVEAEARLDALQLRRLVGEIGIGR